MDSCCLKKKKTQFAPPPAQPLLKSSQIKIPELYKIDQLIYSPKPPIRQQPSPFTRKIQKQNPEQYSQSVQKTKVQQKEKQQKSRAYSQQYPLYPPFVYRQKLRKENERKPIQKSYNNLIKRLNFNTRNKLNLKNKNQPQEEMFMKIPMVRTFVYDQQVIDVSDQYVEHYYLQFQQQQKEEKQRRQRQIKQREELKKIQFSTKESGNKLI